MWGDIKKLLTGAGRKRVGGGDKCQEKRVEGCKFANNYELLQQYDSKEI